MIRFLCLPTGSDCVLCSFLPSCVRSTVIATSRTHVKQARALRIPEVCVHIFAPIHTAAWFRLSLVLAFVYLCSLMNGMQMPPGTTECNHSYYTSNSFSAPQFARQLQHGTLATPAQPPASIQEIDGPASSGAISRSLLSRSTISSQVTADPTRNGTGDVMPLAEAITQLSFIEFLQRCGVSIAPPLVRLDNQCPSHFWMLLCRRLHLVTSLRRCPRRHLIM